MLGQNIKAGNAQGCVSILDERRYIRGTLKNYLHAWHATNTGKILAWIAAIDFHTTFGEKGQSCTL